jgi:hypothetical protein
MGRCAEAWIVALVAALPAFAVGATDDIGNNPFRLEDALANGRFSLELRPRYNRIDETDKPKLTEGGTVRGVLGWRSAPFEGLRLTVEAIHTDNLGRKRFNDNSAEISTSPYPLLPDPRYSGVNQVFVDYTGLEATRFRVGRQVMRFGNERWVSNNDFRQIPQLFDGVTLANTSLANTELSASYFSRVRTTSGVLNDLRLMLVNAAWNPVAGHALSAYGVFHDQAQNGAFTGFADNSYRVLGVRGEGAAARFGAIEIPYVVELAQQRPYAGGDARVKGIYWRAGAGVGGGDWTLRYDQEVKRSNGGVYGVQMPLTDFYAYNGWTLHFFNTPRQGLRDRWLTARYSFAPFTFYGEVHRFRSDFGGIDFGKELDLGITYSVTESLVARLQHARYDPGAGTLDPGIRKTWLTLSYVY